MKTTYLLFSLSVIAFYSTSVLAQVPVKINCNADSLKARLLVLKENKMKNYNLELDASKQIDRLIKIGVLSSKKPEANCDTVLKNFGLLLDSFGDKSERVLGMTRKPNRVTKNSVRTGLASICPIYPFCK